jgi:hypothetical protein
VVAVRHRQIATLTCALHAFATIAVLLLAVEAHMYGSVHASSALLYLPRHEPPLPCSVLLHTATAGTHLEHDNDCNLQQQ